MKQLLLILVTLAAIGVFESSVARAGDTESLFVTPEYAAAYIGKPSDMVLVDVRSPGVFGNMNIPGSINIPPHFIRNRNHLLQKQIVLVNQGFATQELIGICDGLRELGIDAKILKGGFAAWVLKNLPVRGNPASDKGLFLVPPLTAFQENTSQSFLPVDISGKQGAREVFAGTVYSTASMDEDPDGLFEVLARFNTDYSTTNILVFNHDGTGYETLRNQAVSAGTENLFFLNGGLDAYQEFLETRKLVNVPRSERILSLGKAPCTTCNFDPGQ